MARKVNVLTWGGIDTLRNTFRLHKEQAVSFQRNHISKELYTTRCSCVGMCYYSSCSLGGIYSVNRWTWKNEKLNRYKGVWCMYSVTCMYKRSVSYDTNEIVSSRVESSRVASHAPLPLHMHGLGRPQLLLMFRCCSGCTDMIRHRARSADINERLRKQSLLLLLALLHTLFHRSVNMYTSSHLHAV